jgi:hypothetical protein
MYSKVGPGSFEPFAYCREMTRTGNLADMAGDLRCSVTIRSCLAPTGFVTTLDRNDKSGANVYSEVSDAYDHPPSVKCVMVALALFFS